jgi:arylsulfatase A-like enzyme
LEASALGDWIKDSYPQAKVFSASGKDRAAILMGGHKADGAFWFDVDIGGFETSEYYNEPQWLESFNGQRRLNEFFGQLWEPLPLAPEAIEQLQLESLDLGPLLPGFPHAIGRPRAAPDDGFYNGLRDSPWWDDYLGQFGQFIIEAEDLGSDADPDMLALSFSALDYVGHDYGSHSREYVDVLLRLDQTLARLLEFIDERVGLENTVIGLSADHGVVGVPELRQRRGLEGTRIGWQTILCIEQVGLELAAHHGVDSWLVTGPRLAPDLSESTGRPREDLERETADRLEECPHVAAVWTSTTLVQQVDESEPKRWQFANSYYPERSADFLIQFDEYFMPAPTLTTTHGSAYSYDTRVPLVLTAPNIGVGSVDSRVHTVDMAPTLAALLGLSHRPEVDGHDLSPLLPIAGQFGATAVASN